MVTAALASFALLAIAWIVAPDRPRQKVEVVEAVPEAEPMAA